MSTNDIVPGDGGSTLFSNGDIKIDGTLKVGKEAYFEDNIALAGDIVATGAQQQLIEPFLNMMSKVRLLREK